MYHCNLQSLYAGLIHTKSPIAYYTKLFSLLKEIFLPGFHRQILFQYDNILRKISKLVISLFKASSLHELKIKFITIRHFETKFFFLKADNGVYCVVLKDGKNVLPAFYRKLIDTKSQNFVDPHALVISCTKLQIRYGKVKFYFSS